MNAIAYTAEEFFQLDDEAQTENLLARMARLTPERRAVVERELRKLSLRVCHCDDRPRDYAPALQAFGSLPDSAQRAMLHDLEVAVMRAGLRRNDAPVPTDAPRPALRLVRPAGG